MAGSQEFFRAEQGQLPEQSAAFIIPASARDDVFERIKNWASSGGLSYRTVELDPEKSVFGVDVWSSDILIAGENYADVNTFRFDFYAAGGERKRLAEAKAAEFRALLASIQGVQVLP